MVIATSALLATLFGDPEREAFATLMGESPTRLVSAVNSLEASIVTLVRKGPPGVRELDLLYHVAQLDVVPFDADQMMLAREAYQRYGRGRHPAGLTLGDCCAYALARHSGEPLLFKGAAFAKTDVRPVLYPST